MLGMRKGQGATEYLVLLAVVLVIALVSIALLGFFPGLATDARITQSRSYWNAASPIAVIDATLSNGASPAMTLVLQNNGPDSVTITAINDNTLVAGDIILGPGSRATTPALTGFTPANCAIGEIREVPLTFSYGSASLPNQVQNGTKPYALKCS